MLSAQTGGGGSHRHQRHLKVACARPEIRGVKVGTGLALGLG